MSQRDWELAERLLAEPFPADRVKFRAGATTKDKTRALALAYVDARDVMERLDAAVGVAGWSDAYRIVSDTVVECTLTVLGVTKTDVGYPNGADDEEPLKAAFSDSFKRAAVKFGIGRDLYARPAAWVGYDAEHKRLVMGEGTVPVPPAVPAPAIPTAVGTTPPDRVADSPALAPPGDAASPLWTPLRLMDARPEQEHTLGPGDRHTPSHRPLRARADRSLFCPTRVDGAWCSWHQDPDPARPTAVRGPSLAYGHPSRTVAALPATSVDTTGDCRTRRPSPTARSVPGHPA